MTVADVRDSTLTGLALSRTSGPDFTADDRLIMTLLRRPLMEGRLRAGRDSAVVHASSRVSPLTDREFQILEMVDEGKTNAAIARCLQRSPRPVSKHLEQAYR